MLQVIAIALTGLVALGVAFGVTFVLGMRARSPIVHRAVFWLCKRFMNPRQLRTAGTPGAYAAIIRAPGRRSARMYETPVGVVEHDGSALIALPYGTSPQWLRNVRAAGAATIVHEGRQLAVDTPEVIPMATVADRFPGDELSMRILGVDQCLRLRILGPAADAGASPVTDAA